jgi:2-dehydropantoate 2-reductase
MAGLPSDVCDTPHSFVIPSGVALSVILPYLRGMKFAVVGCGALGSYYGAKLCRDGHEVHFLLRSDYEIVRRQGVRILSPEGNFHVNPKCARTPEEIGPVDVVLIGLKTTANDQFAKLLPPLVGPHTAILTLQNGLGNEEALAKLFPPEQILGGLCFVCLNRIEPGIIDHQAHGKIVMGEFNRWPEPRTHDIATAIRHSGVPCVVSDSLAKARWEKLVWNIPFNGLGVASAAGIEAFQNPHPNKENPVERLAASSPSPLGGERAGVRGAGVPFSTLHPCLTTDLLLADPRWHALVRELMHEVIAAAHAQGHDLPSELVDKMIKNTSEMGAYKPSTLLDFQHGLPLELETMFREPLRRAQQAGVSVPRLTRLCEILADLEKSNTRKK